MCASGSYRGVQHQHWQQGTPDSQSQVCQWSSCLFNRSQLLQRGMQRQRQHAMQPAAQSCWRDAVGGRDPSDMCVQQMALTCADQHPPTAGEYGCRCLVMRSCRATTGRPACGVCFVTTAASNGRHTAAQKHAACVQLQCMVSVGQATGQQPVISGGAMLSVPSLASWPMPILHCATVSGHYVGAGG